MRQIQSLSRYSSQGPRIREVSRSACSLDLLLSFIRSTTSTMIRTGGGAITTATMAAIKRGRKKNSRKTEYVAPNYALTCMIKREIQMVIISGSFFAPTHEPIALHHDQDAHYRIRGTLSRIDHHRSSKAQLDNADALISDEIRYARYAI